MYNWKTVIALIFAVSVFLFFFIRGKPWFSHFNAHALLEKYSHEEIDHFGKFAFKDGGLEKWCGKIKYENINRTELSPSILNSVDECVNQLNSLMEEGKIEHVTHKSNVEIYFVEKIPAYWGRTRCKLFTFKFPYPTIRGGVIKIVVHKRQPDELNSTILHEFTHLLGFNHNFTIDYQSIFNPSPKTLASVQDGNDVMVPTFQKYTGLDSAAICIMYDADVALDPGMTKKKFYKKIEEVRKEIKNKISY